MIIRTFFSIHSVAESRVTFLEVEFNQTSNLMSAAFAACHESSTGYKLVAIRKHWQLKRILWIR
jgi:hypothetical protein